MSVNKPGAEQYKVEGELTFATVNNWLTLSDQWTQGGGPITVDLRAVTKADSAGLALLIEWQRRARNLKRQLVINNLPAKLKDLIRVSGLSELFPQQRAA